MGCFLRNSSTLLDAPTDCRKTCASKLVFFLGFSLSPGPPIRRSFAMDTSLSRKHSFRRGPSGLYTNVRGTGTAGTESILVYKQGAVSKRGWYEDPEQGSLQGTERACGSRRRCEETEQNRQRN